MADFINVLNKQSIYKTDVSNLTVFDISSREKTNNAKRYKATIKFPLSQGNLSSIIKGPLGA